jgi:hypothetical protein
MLALLPIAKDIVLLVVGALLGFFFSYRQWKLSLAQAEKERRREKLELMHVLLNRYAELVRYTIHKRNQPGLDYPEVGPNPMPEIEMLKNLYVPEVASAINELRNLFSNTVESQLSPPAAAFNPINAKIRDIQQVIRSKIDALN